MAAIAKKRDFTEGPLFFKITLFALPIMLTGFLQVAYSMADNIVVGQFSSDPNALAALGSTGPLNTILINLLLGLSAGTGVVVSQFFGAKDDESVSRSAHTAMLISIIGGVLFMSIGLSLSRTALALLGTKEEIFESALLYFRIICIGVPASSIYNFGASILRATGNSRLPLIILGTTGLVNVGLNLFFVLVLGMAVDGVAIATVVAQYLSAFAVVAALICKRKESYAIDLRKLRIHSDMLRKILRLGVPAGIQSSMFSIANIFMVNAINTFPTTTVTGYTIANNIDSFVFTAMNGFGQAAMTFTGQNYGAKKPERIKKAIIYCLIQDVAIASIFALFEFLLRFKLIGMFIGEYNATTEEVIRAAAAIMTVMLLSMPLGAIQDALAGALKGLGYSFNAMISGILGICGVRMLWIWIFFPMERFNSLMGLYVAFPLSWGTASLIMLVSLLIAYASIKRKFARVSEGGEING